MKLTRPSPVDLVVDSLATFRLARLITTDTLPPIMRAREWVWRRFPPEGRWLQADDGWSYDDDEGVASRVVKGHTVEVNATATAPGSTTYVTDEAHPIGELIGCPWCVSMWIAFGVTAARAFAPRLWDPLARVLAFSAVTGIVATET